MIQLAGNSVRIWGSVKRKAWLRIWRCSIFLDPKEEKRFPLFWTIEAQEPTYPKMNDYVLICHVCIVPKTSCATVPCHVEAKSHSASLHWCHDMCLSGRVGGCVSHMRFVRNSFAQVSRLVFPFAAPHTHSHTDTCMDLCFFVGTDRCLFLPAAFTVEISAFLCICFMDLGDYFVL